jgi:hypothetical protein
MQGKPMIMTCTSTEGQMGYILPYIFSSNLQASTIRVQVFENNMNQVRVVKYDATPTSN